MEDYCLYYNDEGSFYVGRPYSDFYRIARKADLHNHMREEDKLQDMVPPVYVYGSDGLKHYAKMVGIDVKRMPELLT